MKKNNKRHLAAIKANQTRGYRNLFMKRYPQTWYVAADILEGYYSRKELNQIWGTAHTAAVRANLNRSCEYADLAHKCNF